MWRCGFYYSLAVLGDPSPPPPPPPLFGIYMYFFSTEPFALYVRVPIGGLAQGARGLVASWAGQSGVLAPWICVTAVAAPGLHGHLPSTGDLGVKFSHKVLFGTAM